MSDERRQVCSSPIICKHCGYLPSEFVEYFEGCAGWCPDCAYANSLIDEEQLRQDKEDGKEAYKVYLRKEMEKLNDYE